MNESQRMEISRIFVQAVTNGVPGWGERSRMLVRGALALLLTGRTVTSREIAHHVGSSYQTVVMYLSRFDNLLRGMPLEGSIGFLQYGENAHGETTLTLPQ